MRRAWPFAWLVALVAAAWILPAARAAPPEARVALERAYRRAPTVELLYQLGQLARAEGREAAALDLLGRYLEEAGEGVASAQRAEIERILRAPRAPGGEILVSGDSGAILLVDGRVAGALPLSRPLWLAVGSHELLLERRGARAQATIDVLARRRVALRFSLDPPAAVVSPTPGLLALVDGLQMAQLRRAVPPDRALLIADAEAEAALRREPGLRACIPQAHCLERLGRAVEADFVLRLRAERGQRLAAELFDVAVGAVAATGEQALLGSDATALARGLGDLLPALLLAGTTRAQGSLRVTSLPSAAVVLVDGQQRGLTPYEGPAFAGARQLVVARQGFAPARVSAVVEENQPARLALTLQRRPRRAFPALRWASLGAGLLVVGAGAALLALDGYQTCPKADIGHCPEEFNGAPGGGAALAGGGLLLGLSALSFALEHRASQRERAELLGLGVRF